MFYRSYIVLDKEELIEEFLKLEGIDGEIALKLYNAGIKSISDLKSSDPQNLSEKIGYPIKLVKSWINSIVKYEQQKKFEKSEEIIIKLKDSLNCSYEIAKTLRNVGILSLEDLTNEDPAQLADDAEIDLKYIKLWIKKAKKILKSK